MYPPPDVPDHRIAVMIDPSWMPINEYINLLLNENPTFEYWEVVNLQVGSISLQYLRLNERFRYVFRQIITAFHRSHQNGFYSGRLTQANYDEGRTGIYICHENDNGDTFLIAERGMGNFNDQSKLNAIEADLRGFGDIIEYVTMHFPTSSRYPAPGQYPHEYVTFLRLIDEISSYNGNIESIMIFGYFVYRWVLFMDKGERMSLIRVIDSTFKTCGFQAIQKNIDLRHPDTDLVDWHLGIPLPQLPGYSNFQTAITETTWHYYSKFYGADFPLFNVLRFKKNQNWGTNYQYEWGILPFMRNCLEHAVANDVVLSEEVLRAQLPDALPKVFLAMIKGTANGVPLVQHSPETFYDRVRKFLLDV